MGAITEGVRRMVPATYDAMLVATTANRLFSLDDLQALADYVKNRLFSTVVNATAESVLYSPSVNQFLGKLTTLQFIPAAVDYWDSQLSSIVATGTGEVANFRDHRDGLLKLYELLQREVIGDAALLGISLKASGLLPGVSYYDGDKHILKTPDPSCFPPVFSRHRHSSLPWVVNA